MFNQCLLILFFIGSIFADTIIFPSSTSCPKLRLEHGKARPRGRLVKFTCNSRFSLVGNRYATCRNGRWDVPAPVCIRAGCSSISELENGIQISSNNDAWIIFFCLPGFKLKGSQTIFCDGRRWNATAPTCIDSNAVAPLSCNFEDPDLCGWTNSELHDFDWERLNNKTPSSFLNTGPSFDHTYGNVGTGYYMYIETTSRYENDKARLLSPIYDRSLLKDGCFSFFYHMYGNGTGGLRVYLKPDFMDLQQLTRPGEINKKYLLFEKWGNQGDFWYSSVSPFIDVGDNFQIVIEGIRGNSFTSDIAIDDVDILQGNNCTLAAMVATTPSTTTAISESCENRCFEKDTRTVGCKCSETCFLEENCCIDFFDLCFFLPDATILDDGIDWEPQTQKLIASTRSTSTTSTSSSTSTTTSTTPKPTTMTTTTTTRRPTTSTTSTITSTTTPRPSTIRTTPRTTTKSTTKLITTRTTTVMPTTIRTIKTTKPVIPTTRFVTKPPTTTSIKITTISRTPKVLSKATTFIPFGTLKTEEHHEAKINDKERKEKEIETRKIKHLNFQELRPGGTSGWQIFLILLGVVACIGTASWIGLVTRTSRGRETIARLRGHIIHDPEVRFLSSDVDED